MTVDSPEPGMTFEERFASLEQASRLLSVDVQGLNSALAILAQLQTEQTAQRVRQEETDKQIALSRLQSEDRDRHTRRTLMRSTLAMSIILPAVSIIVYWVLIDHVNDLLDQQARDRHESCLIRNKATQSNIDRELALGKVIKDPEERLLHTASAASLRGGLLDCERYRPR